MVENSDNNITHFTLENIFTKLLIKNLTAEPLGKT